MRTNYEGCCVREDAWDDMIHKEDLAKALREFALDRVCFEHLDTTPEEVYCIDDDCNDARKALVAK